MTVTLKFKDLDLDASLQKAIDEIGYTDCTPIQAQCIPLLLQGKDVAGLAQTGTGKTGAFLIPLIDRVLRSAIRTDSTSASVQVEGETPAVADPRIFPDWQRRQFVLVLVPTRELCEQVLENAEKLLKYTPFKAVSIYGGTSYDKQKQALRDGVEFIIATPGRLMDLYKEHLLDFKQVRAVIFDEADRMFDMGFQDDMKFILRRIPENRQFLLFSATLNFAVMNIAYQFGAEPVEINVSKDQAKAENIDDEIYHVGDEKPRFLLSLLKKSDARQVIIFSNFKKNVDRIAQFLTANGLPAMGISSLMTQAQRTRVIAQFKAVEEGARPILVATDVAARGLDILGVDLVVNYELPDDAENYVHRIGRTGRAGQKGKAASLLGDRDVEALQRIEEYTKLKLKVGWMEDADLVDPKEMKPMPSDYHARSHGQGGRDRKPGFKPRRDGPRDDRPRREGNRPQNAGLRPEQKRADQPQQKIEQRPPHKRLDPNNIPGLGPKPTPGAQRQNQPRHENNRHENKQGRPQQSSHRNDKSNRRPVKLKNRPGQAAASSGHRTASTQTNGAAKTKIGNKITNFVRSLFKVSGSKPTTKPTEKSSTGKPSIKAQAKPTRSSGKS